MPAGLLWLHPHLQHALADLIVDGITRRLASQRGVLRSCRKQCSRQAGSAATVGITCPATCAARHKKRPSQHDAACGVTGMHKPHPSAASPSQAESSEYRTADCGLTSVYAAPRNILGKQLCCCSSPAAMLMMECSVAACSWPDVVLRSSLPSAMLLRLLSMPGAWSSQCCASSCCTGSRRCSWGW